MILVLASPRDLPARRLVEAWGQAAATLVTPGDLSRAGWCHHVADPWIGPGAADLAVAGGACIPASSITGVVTRIPGVAADELLHVAEPDREYVAAEITAFLVAWLSQLPCPVINRPAPGSLMGAPHAPEGWAAVAARAGLALSWTRRRFPPAEPEPWPAGAITISLLAGRCFGEVDPALAEQARRLASAADVELLSVTFSHAGPDAAFVGAHVWPDVSFPDLAAALLTRFAPGTAPRPAEAGP